MEMLKTGRSVFGAVLANTLVFKKIDVYGEANTTVSVAEVVGRLLQVISRIAGSSIVICVLELCDGSGASVYT